MFQIKKSDLSLTYNVKAIQEKAKKEQSRWMWLILLGCFLFQMLPYCVALNLTNVFVGSDWIAWTQGNVTIIGLTFTAGSLAAALSGPFIAKILGKQINMKFVYGLGVLLAMIGFAGSSINAFIPENQRSIGVVATILFTSNIISQIGVMIFSGLGVNNLISKWWPTEKRGFALGVAFMGGSFGNIWMQQILGKLSEVFGNTLYQGIGNQADFGYITNGEQYIQQTQYFSHQYATYLIMTGLGLVTGLLVVIFVCKKPLPPTQIFGSNLIDAKTSKIVSATQQSVNLEASPLVTRKYPVYWILAIGYLILQMGTVHSSTNGQFVQNGIAFNGNGQYSAIMALGGTLFGIFCLIGNFSGGVLNDKIGPTKSILLAGSVQCCAIMCLMLSMRITELIYLYFALAGLSVYVYTSTPSFISGRLFGAKQSTNHMAILGMFIALGFAIVNSITGSLTGPVNDTNIHEMFGVKTRGNYFALGMFAFSCMATGTLIVTICSALITRKGIKGLLEYSPTKYSRVIFFKHSLNIFFSSLLIEKLKKDFRNNKKWKKKNELKIKNDNYSKSFDLISNEFKNKFNKLDSNQQKIISVLAFYEVVTFTQLKKITNKSNIDNLLKVLTKKKIINETNLGSIESFYSLTNASKKKLNDTLLNNYDLINNENKKIYISLSKIDKHCQNKITKLNGSINKNNNKKIDKKKEEKLVTRSNLKLKKLECKRNKIFSRIKNKDDWTKYKIEYAYLEKLYYAKELKNKLNDKKINKINVLNNKINTCHYVANYNKNKLIEGHDLLVNYYSDKTTHCNKLISNQVIDNLDRKIEIAQKRSQLIINKKEKIEDSLL